MSSELSRGLWPSEGGQRVVGRPALPQKHYALTRGPPAPQPGIRGGPVEKWGTGRAFSRDQQAASRSLANSAASAASFQNAFKPLGLGSTQSLAPPSVSSCRPVVAA